MSAQKIGELNGKWALLFKLMLAFNAVAIPITISWATYVSTELWELRATQAVAHEKLLGFIGRGPRYTEHDAIKDGVLVRAELGAPLADLASQMTRMQADMTELKLDVRAIQKKMGE